MIFLVMPVMMGGFGGLVCAFIGVSDMGIYCHQL